MRVSGAPVRGFAAATPDPMRRAALPCYAVAAMDTAENATTTRAAVLIVRGTMVITVLPLRRRLRMRAPELALALIAEQPSCQYGAHEIAGRMRRARDDHRVTASRS